MRWIYSGSLTGNGPCFSVAALHLINFLHENAALYAFKATYLLWLLHCWLIFVCLVNAWIPIYTDTGVQMIEYSKVMRQYVWVQKRKKCQHNIKFLSLWTGMLTFHCKLCGFSNMGMNTLELLQECQTCPWSGSDCIEIDPPVMKFR